MWPLSSTTAMVGAQPLRAASASAPARTFRAASRVSDCFCTVCATSPSACVGPTVRSEEHTSELQSLMRISYAVFCLKKKTTQSLNHYLIDVLLVISYTIYTSA